MPPALSTSDLRALLWVIRYVSTSDPQVQDEVIRLHTVLEQELQRRTKREHT